MPTAVVVPPGKPTVRHVRNVKLQPGRQGVAVELRGVRAARRRADALAFFAQLPAAELLPHGVTVERRIRGDRVSARRRR